MLYAIAHAHKGRTFVAKQVDLTREPEIIRLDDDPVLPASDKAKKKQKVAFILQIQSGDQVCIELGGPNAKLALALLSRGAQVYQIPTHKWSKLDPQVVVIQHSWRVEEESAHGEETVETLTNRKARTLAMCVLFNGSPEQFYPLHPCDVANLKLKIAYRSFRAFQKSVIQVVGRCFAAFQDEVFVDLASVSQQDALLGGENGIYNATIDAATTYLLGGDAQPEERERLEHLMDERFGGTIPQQVRPEDVEAIVDALLQGDQFMTLNLGRLKELSKKIEKLLKGGKIKLVGGGSVTIPPNDIYEKVFVGIPGCGVLTCAKIMGEILDIRRFATFPALKAYAGYHHEEDGSRSHSRKGSVYPVNKRLKTAVWLWCSWTVKCKDSPYRQLLDARKAYELWKLLRERQAQVDVEGSGYQMLPDWISSEEIAGVESFLPEDTTAPVVGYEKLKEHVAMLRKVAGVTRESDEEVAEEDGAKTTVKDPVLAKMVRGLLQAAHQKGLRWLGQRFLRDIFRKWRVAVGLGENPVKG